MSSRPRGHIRQRGSTWYYVAELGNDPATGKRRQRMKGGFPTEREAKRALTALLAEIDKGNAPASKRTTFAKFAATWLAGKAQTDIRANTLRGYRSNAGTACQHFGAVPLADVTRQHVQDMVTAMVKAGRSARTTSLLLFVVRSIFAEALADGLVTRNPAARVKASGRAARQREALSPAELGMLRAHLSGDRLAAVWLLTLYGLRRSEVMALTWADVDLSTGMLSIERGVTSDDHGRRSPSTPPKTERGRRELPLPADTITALRALREAQGAAFGLGHMRTGYLAVDEAGAPYRPEMWSDLWTSRRRPVPARDVVRPVDFALPRGRNPPGHVACCPALQRDHDA
jgi:integrase